MKLVILHYHLRPGGIRRVIELAAPHIVRASNRRITQVTLASGEQPDRKWHNGFLQAMDSVPVEFFIEPSFGYFSDQRHPPSAIRARIQFGLERLLGSKNNESHVSLSSVEGGEEASLSPLSLSLSPLVPRRERELKGKRLSLSSDTDECIVWAHNLGLARNLLLTQELMRICERRGITLLAHHHDWWFDNRWQRWPEMQSAGFRTFAFAAKAVFGSPHARHIAINHSDWNVLRNYFPERTQWLPNLSELTPAPPASRVRKAHHWLQSKLDHDHAPVWILPCRLLRRKNVAEALLLKRWLRPEAWLVTTGDVTSAEEQPYFNKLNAAARKHHWRIRLGVLAGDESRKPSVAELLAACEAVLLTSVQEGFGLPYLEAAAAGRPLIARNLPNVAPDLAQFGFTFPQSYDEILIHPSLFDWRAEKRRQQQLYMRWKKQLPPLVRRWAGKPVLLAAGNRPKPVPFSRLTLTAQIEVLAKPVSHSWDLCAPLNPFLTDWRRRAQNEKLRVTLWPRSAERWLSGRTYAKRFHESLRMNLKKSARLNSALGAQTKFVHLKLAASCLYPLLWNSNT